MKRENWRATMSLFGADEITDPEQAFELYKARWGNNPQKWWRLRAQVVANDDQAMWINRVSFIACCEVSKRIREAKGG